MTKYLSLIILLFIFIPLLADNSNDKFADEKAEFILGLPTQSESSSDTNPNPNRLTIAVIGNSPVTEELRKLIKDSDNELEIVIETITLEDDFSNADILFFSEVELSDLAAILKKVRKKPIITVTDAEGFARYGVMVEFITDNDRLEYAINNMASRDAGIKFSKNIVSKAKLTFG